MSVNNVLFSVAEAIPLLGPSIKGALEALYKVLVLIETRFQIKEDVEELLQRIESLVERLGLITPTPSAPLVRLISRLEEISANLGLLLKKKRLRYDVIAASIAQCNSRINSYLQECTLLTVVGLEMSLRAREVTVEKIIVVDPLGFKQTFEKPLKQDISLIAQWVLERYGENPQLQLLLKGFVDQGNFEITIDDGLKAIPVPPELLPHLASNTALVMSVVTYQSATPQQTTVSCPSCHKDIPVQVSEDSRTSERVFCPHCDRHVQADPLAQAKPESSDEENLQDVSRFLRNIIVKLLLDIPWYLRIPSNEGPLYSPSSDYIQLVYNHVRGMWEGLPATVPGMHTLRLLVNGVEVGRASASRKQMSKKIIAYKYLRDNGYLRNNDEGMEAMLRGQ
ncbi:hypothetical protein EST38_g14040 [Candolleomyces aberdarensis]|uniref:Uncharacterized protein n=1 Tax=Candolleomyces aberdarensis TaxID=2316362 RepID=A0A4Q2D118_9AGAR|nr:hypothetical protein EST38_g14040 [Candolleomyces aberdarensis]